MSQRSKGNVSINRVGHTHLSPGNTDIVHSGEFRHGQGVMPDMKKASKYDHGTGPKEYTHMGKSLAKSGKSQNPKQTYLAKNGTGAGTVNK